MSFKDNKLISSVVSEKIKGDLEMFLTNSMIMKFFSYIVFKVSSTIIINLKSFSK